MNRPNPARHSLLLYLALCQCFPKHSERSDLTCVDDMALAMQEIYCEQQMDQNLLEHCLG